MLDFVYDRISDQQFIVSLLAAVAAGATLLTLLDGPSRPPICSGGA